VRKKRTKKKKTKKNKNKRRREKKKKRKKNQTLGLTITRRGNCGSRTKKICLKIKKNGRIRKPCRRHISALQLG
jgi:hypothetical protein